MTSTSTFFTSNQLELLNKHKIPRHVAIIPDGNRRWAKKQMENPIEGHRSGANTLIEIVKAAKELGIKALTFYTFSTENWTRSEEEINAFMWLLQEFLLSHCQEMIDLGVRLKTIGDIALLPKEAAEAVAQTMVATAECEEIDMIMALNYGSRDELRRAFQRILEDCEKKKIQKEQISEALIAQYLDTAPWGDPDLFIRTSGENRISNFLLWQLSYTEIYITEVLWPDFTPNDLLKAVIEFQKRDRRLGGT